MKQSIFAFLIILTFLPICVVLASVEINEIMYDLPGSDEGREWIEVFNNSSEEVDMSELILLEAGVNHKMVLRSGSAKVPAYGYAVIVSDDVGWRGDWPNFSGTIFDSSFSLSNTSESLAIKDKDKVLSEYAYSSGLGAGGDGESLQRVNGVWAPSLPTLGGENKISVKVKKPAPVVAVAKTKAVSTEQAETQLLEFPPTLVLEVESSENSYLPIFSLPVFVGLMASFVYFLRKRGRKSTLGDDFKILEE